MANATKMITDLCLPAKINLVLSFLNILWNIYSGYKVFSIFVSLLFIAFWTWVLTLLCNSGYDTLAMILVIGPFILSLMFIALGFEAWAFVNKKNKKNKKKGRRRKY
jgi:hypothetical protein